MEGILVRQVFWKQFCFLYQIDLNMFKIKKADIEIPCVSLRSLMIVHSQSQDLAVFNKVIMILAYILYCIFYWIPRGVQSTLRYEWHSKAILSWNSSSW